MIATQHLDANTLEELQLVMEDEFAGLLQTFVQDSGQRVATIRRAITWLDPVVLRTAAHTLKGSSSNMGARNLALLCKRIEEMALAGETTACESLLFEIEAEYDGIKAEVAALS